MDSVRRARDLQPSSGSPVPKPASVAQDAQHAATQHAETRHTETQQTQSSPDANATGGKDGPAITVPKGGGSIRGMGEKFTVDAMTGTSSISLPVSTTAGRSGIDPSLSLVYSSGGGNGPFGLGWQLSLQSASITRKVDRGVPRYGDGLVADEQDDTFIISGLEDLAVAHKLDSSGKEVRDPHGNVVLDETPRGDFMVRRYLPRVEGSFLRVERWMRKTDPTDSYWRTISRDNVVAIYGNRDESRILSLENGRRIFSWLLVEVYDGRGDAVLYSYKADDLSNVPPDAICDRNRSTAARKVNRYIKSIRYGNRDPNRDLTSWEPFSPSLLSASTWMFEVIFDYGEHVTEGPTTEENIPWKYREDAFSTYRAGFEIRTSRLCRRILMFHHFPGEGSSRGRRDLLVSSMNLSYGESPTVTYLSKIQETGYAPIPSDGEAETPMYTGRSLPPTEFEYSRFPEDERLAQLPIKTIDSLGLVAQGHRWLDLDGEGMPGVLVQSGGSEFRYARNLTSNNTDAEGEISARFGELKLVESQPSVVTPSSRFFDVSGNGTLDLVATEQATWGFSERQVNLRNEGVGWKSFVPFPLHPNLNPNDPYLRFVDLTGDGLADILITEDQVFSWYKCLGRDGYAEETSVFYSIDEEKSPRVVFADQDHSIYLADMSGDGLMDIARVRRSEVCYWPNLGYGMFGSKVTLGNSPQFDRDDLFNQKRVFLTDIDGSGTTDVIYLPTSGGCDVYLNESGNTFASVKKILSVPPVDTLSSVTSADILGNGTSCLVWTSELPSFARRPAFFLDINEGKKPHLLTTMRNNRGATRVFHYAPSTKFYLDDTKAGKPWITRLPFPVQCVEKVETLDEVSKNRFSTRYRYHHGYFDGIEREFRGFAMVETWDTDEYGQSVSGGGDWTNEDLKSDVPPVHTKTWFHTGAFIEGEEISRMLAEEYYGAPKRDNTAAFEVFLDSLLPDTLLPTETVAITELREACRALKGRQLRHEIYADDKTDSEGIPYAITEANFALHLKQGLAGNTVNKHAVILATDREKLSYSYERNLVDPRVTHELVLETDRFGNRLKSASIAYGRQAAQPDLEGPAQDWQSQRFITYDENDWTVSIDDQDQYLGPKESGLRSFEILEYPLPSDSSRFSFDQLAGPEGLTPLPAISYEGTTTSGVSQKRLIEESVTKYRSNDLSLLLAKDHLEFMGFHGQTYLKAFSPGLIEKVFMRPDASGAKQPLIPIPKLLLEGTSSDRGGYVDLLGDGCWWIPSSRQYFDPSLTASPEQELATGRQGFFNLRRQVTPFGQSALYDYDSYHLSLVRSQDAASNVVLAEIDYRTLQPHTVTDPNGNISEVAYDELGNVAALALRGKASPAPKEGDELGASFNSFLTQSQLDELYDDPLRHSLSILGSATVRYTYDFSRSPALAISIRRETHASDLSPGEVSKLQIGISYFDGFSRPIQKRSKAEPAPPPPTNPTPPAQWITSGWKIFNNKGNVIRQYEPSFDASHQFKSDQIGVSTVNFYDPLSRAIGTLYPDHSYSKIVFNPWESRNYDRNDTAGENDPRNDPHIGAYFSRLDPSEFLPSWRDTKLSGTDAEKRAARNVLVHDNTYSSAYFDALGRSFFSIVRNKTAYDDGSLPTTSEERLATFTVVDIEGNPREVRDARNYVSFRNDFDMINRQIHSSNAESGERWSVFDVLGKPLVLWDNRDRIIRHDYDELRRPSSTLLREGGDPELVVERIEYGEAESSPETHNLRGRPVRVFDQAGLLTTDKYDFKGNATSMKRQVSLQHEGLLAHSKISPAPLDGDLPTYITEQQFDALNRVTQTTTRPGDNVVFYTYNETGLVKTVSATIRGSETITLFVNNITYNAKGQRVSIDFANMTKTEYTYDPETFRLKTLVTTRDRTKFPLTYLVQNLSYTYDPVGNITTIMDDAQSVIFFNGARVEPKCEYTYDSSYQMIEAFGREHVGQTTGGNPTPPDGLDSFHTGNVSPGISSAMARYHERYVYDPVGNIQTLRHFGSDNLHQGWTRQYKYELESPLEPGTGHMTNLLTSTTIQGREEAYTYDKSGNMLSCPTVRSMKWDWKNQLVESSTQIVNNGGAPERTFYSYDAGGERVRKFVENQHGPGETALKKGQRIYLGGFETYISYLGGGVSSEEETVHIMDSNKTVVLVETTIDPSEATPQRLIRYQYTNHQGSCSLELTETAILISYEEYFPFGSTSYQALSSTEVSKRYRYTGKERDIETHLQYSGKRYYAPWLGRWMSADPAGMVAGTNLYAYVKNNPINNTDPGGTDPLPIFQLPDVKLTPLTFGKDTSTGFHFSPPITLPPLTLNGNPGNQSLGNVPRIGIGLPPNLQPSQQVLEDIINPKPKPGPHPDPRLSQTTTSASAGDDNSSSGISDLVQDISDRVDKVTKYFSPEKFGGTGKLEGDVGKVKLKGEVTAKSPDPTQLVGLTPGYGQGEISGKGEATLRLPQGNSITAAANGSYVRGDRTEATPDKAGYGGSIGAGLPTSVGKVNLNVGLDYTHQGPYPAKSEKDVLKYTGSASIDIFGGTLALSGSYTDDSAKGTNGQIGLSFKVSFGDIPGVVKALMDAKDIKNVPLDVPAFGLGAGPIPGWPR